MPRAWAFDVALDVSPQFSQLVGDRASLTAVATDTGGADIRYQFSVREAGGDWRIVRDFDTTSTIDWATLDEGSYDLRVIAVDQATSEQQTAMTFYFIDSRITDGNPVVNPTANPLVMLYSVPPCETFGNLRVRFRPVDGTDWTETPFRPCEAGKSVNFYLAGMTADTTHVTHHVGIVDGVLDIGAPLFFATGAFTLPFAGDIVVPIPPDAQTSLEEQVLLSSYLGGPDGRYPIATNLAGEVIWFYEDFSETGDRSGTLFRPLAGGTMLLSVADETFPGQSLIEIDVAGNVLRETGVERLNEQLAALGEDPTSFVHHDAIRLPDGRTAVLGTAERILVDVQGPGDVDVLADTVYVLDEDFQLVWAWNAFDHLDQSEVAVLGETCAAPGGGGGCPPVFLGAEANDWTHANALDYTAGDGNLILSVRHLDAAIKIDYADGAGGGGVVWRMGRGGDFTMLDPGGDSFPWFSHQHYTHFEDGLFAVYDNGNTRVSEEGGGNSRAQVYFVDEANLNVALLRNHDFGDYSPAVGSLELLSNGNLSANNSFLDSNDYPFLPPDETATLVPELLPNGDLSYVWASVGRIYRSWRMKSLYQPSS